MDKSLVVVSKKWGEANIHLEVTNLGIGVIMELDDFINALSIESNTDKATLEMASNEIISYMKRNTVRIL